jgi:hypothetical protein
MAISLMIDTVHFLKLKLKVGMIELKEWVEDHQLGTLMIFKELHLNGIKEGNHHQGMPTSLTGVTKRQVQIDSSHMDSHMAKLLLLQMRDMIHMPEEIWKSINHSITPEEILATLSREIKVKET